MRVELRRLAGKNLALLKDSDMFPLTIKVKDSQSLAVQRPTTESSPI